MNLKCTTTFKSCMHFSTSMSSCSVFPYFLLPCSNKNLNGKIHNSCVIPIHFLVWYEWISNSFCSLCCSLFYVVRARGHLNNWSTVPHHCKALNRMSSGGSSQWAWWITECHQHKNWRSHRKAPRWMSLDMHTLPIHFQGPKQLLLILPLSSLFETSKLAECPTGKHFKNVCFFFFLIKVKSSSAVTVMVHFRLILKFNAEAEYP